MSAFSFGLPVRANKSSPSAFIAVAEVSGLLVAANEPEMAIKKRSLITPDMLSRIDHRFEADKEILRLVLTTHSRPNRWPANQKWNHPPPFPNNAKSLLILEASETP
jgi:hypothetical protein